ncbi:bifunctional Armadillo-like helical/Small GTPase superfamily [Babesia duncani]|uniref:Bifunctional Armadillo-like helical/Small GTPase superfamily n=1 Tax=Babesia duncani TaxID=323732 RepID=A0AAD9PMG8_9APIC|nr:bifunctional Armadillo-like helical/Small GTPase superfamily [Babesia duncani]
MSRIKSQDDASVDASRTDYFIRSRKRFKAYTWKYRKSISPTGSFILLVSQIFGFGMNGIPSVMRYGGWFPTMLANLGFCVIAALCSLMLLKSMTLIPHNENFDQRIEYNTLVKYYLSDFTFKVVSTLHHLGDLCSIICGILTFSKLLDMLFVRTLGYTVALQIYPHFGLCKVNLHLIGLIYEMEGFESAVFAVTLGYILCALICLRLSACALEETMGFHQATFMVMLGCIFQLVFSSFRRILSGDAKFTPPPRLGHHGFYDTILTFVDNYSVASTTPTWANEMTKEVQVVPTLWLSTLFACVVYYTMGYLLCIAFPANSGSIVRDVLMASSGVFTNASICLFVVVTVIPDVVFGCISTRYNLLNLGYCNACNAYFWGCFFPFLFTWAMSNELLFMEIINRLALTAALVCDFVIPAILYLVATQRIDIAFMEQSNSDMYKRAGSIFFSKMGSLRRKITGEIKTLQPENEMQASKSQEPLVDYSKFKIIKAPTMPRCDDHQYNVLEPRIRTKSHGQMESFNLDEHEDVDGESTSRPPSVRKDIEDRVLVFPLQILSENGVIVAYLMVLSLSCLAILPPLQYVMQVSVVLKVVQNNTTGIFACKMSCKNSHSHETDTDYFDSARADELYNLNALKRYIVGFDSHAGNASDVWLNRLKVLQEAQVDLDNLGLKQYSVCFESCIDIVKSLLSHLSSMQDVDLGNRMQLGSNGHSRISEMLTSKLYTDRIAVAQDLLCALTNQDKMHTSVNQVTCTVMMALLRLLQDHSTKVLVKAVLLLKAFLEWPHCPKCPSALWGRNVGTHFEMISILLGRLGDSKSPIVTCAAYGIKCFACSGLLSSVIQVLTKSLDQGVCNGTPKSILVRLRMLWTILKAETIHVNPVPIPKSLVLALQHLRDHRHVKIKQGATHLLYHVQCHPYVPIKKSLNVALVPKTSKGALEPFGKETDEAFLNLCSSVKVALMRCSGLDNAGKSTILRRLAGEDIETVEPTLGFRIKTLEFSGINFWDVGGQESLRPFWRNYYEETDALVWVVDSADLMRLTQSRDEILKVLSEGQMSKCTLLVLANKQDIIGSTSPVEIQEKLRLSQLGHGTSWSIVGCSAYTGDGITNGLEWLISDVSKRIYGN